MFRGDGLGAGDDDHWFVAHGRGEVVDRLQVGFVCCVEVFECEYEFVFVCCGTYEMCYCGESGVARWVVVVRVVARCGGYEVVERFVCIGCEVG